MDKVEELHKSVNELINEGIKTVRKEFLPMKILFLVFCVITLIYIIVQQIFIRRLVELVISTI